MNDFIERKLPRSAAHADSNALKVLEPAVLNGVIYIVMRIGEIGTNTVYCLLFIAKNRRQAVPIKRRSQKIKTTHTT